MAPRGMQWLSDLMEAYMRPEPLPRPDQIGNFDLLVLKITSNGSLVWQRTYHRRRSRGSTRQNDDRTGRIDRARRGHPGGKGGFSGHRRADRQAQSRRRPAVRQAVCRTERRDRGRRRGRSGRWGDLCRRDDDQFGAGSQDAFVLHLEPTGKKALGVVTWGGTASRRAPASPSAAAPSRSARRRVRRLRYSLLAAAAKLSAPKGTLSASAGVSTWSPVSSRRLVSALQRRMEARPMEGTLRRRWWRIAR